MSVFKHADDHTGWAAHATGASTAHTCDIVECLASPVAFVAHPYRKHMVFLCSAHLARFEQDFPDVTPCRTDAFV